MTKKQKKILEWALAPTKKGKKKKVKKPKGLPVGYAANDDLAKKVYSGLMKSMADPQKTVNKLFSGAIGTYNNVVLHPEYPVVEGKWIDFKELAKKEKEQYKKALTKFDAAVEADGVLMGNEETITYSYAKKRRRPAPRRGPEIKTNPVAVAPLPAKRRILRG